MNELKDTTKSSANRVTIYGVTAIILGMLAMMAPGVTGLSIVILLGVLVLLVGIIRIIWAFQVETFGRSMLMFVVGIPTVLCGIALLANPLFASGVLTILLTAYFIIDGIFEIVAGLRHHTVTGLGWLMFGGIVSIMLGLIIWAQYPLSGVWAMGILLGIKLFFVGLIMITGGSAIRSMANV